MSPLSDQPFTAYIGIDWADLKHDICLQAAGAARVKVLVASVMQPKAV